ncbi:MAG: LCP family protein [Clostridia bacterium]|nr:LCP family protein [Clostridia bacterium]MBQ4157834.1 LCP family protein [Clostridia bacterium]
MRRKLLLTVFLIAIMLLSSITYALAQSTADSIMDRFHSMPDIEYNGTNYSMRTRLTTILLAGTDHRGENANSYRGHRNGGQADFILLIVIDDKNDTVFPIYLNRDLMTDITVLNIIGLEAGTARGQICLQHGYGDGRERSCELLKDTVSRTLLNIPIDHYAVMSMDGIKALNDALGGVQVTLEEDFSYYDPEMTIGKTVTLEGDQAELYLRYRYNVGEETSVSRFPRQKQYLLNMFDMLSENKKLVPVVFKAIDPYLVTDMSRGKMTNISNLVLSYEILPVGEIEGESMIGSNGFNEFHADTDSIMRVVLDAFYEPAG